MSRILLTQLEYTDNSIGAKYVNPNYSEYVNSMLVRDNIILSPPEINVMSSKKSYPPSIVKSGKVNNYTSSNVDKYFSKVNSTLNPAVAPPKTLLDTVQKNKRIKSDLIERYVNNNKNLKNIINQRF